MFKQTKTIPLLTEIANREDLSIGDAVVYSALRYKLNLSIKTNFKDDVGYFIICEQKDIMFDTGLSKRTVIKSMQKLESPEINLIKRVQLGRTFKIYFMPYDVDDCYLVKPKLPDAAIESGVDNFGDNMGIDCGKDDSVGVENTPSKSIGAESAPIPETEIGANNALDTEIGAENTLDTDTVPSAESTPISETGAENAPISETGAENAPYNKNIYNKNINNKSNNNYNNNLTLPKGHQPTVVIDDDIYIAFNKSFQKAPNVEIKKVINSLVNHGFEKDLILYVIEETGQNGWSWGSALKAIQDADVKTLDEYLNIQLSKSFINIAPQENVKEFRNVVNGLIPMDKEPSEWDGIDQYKLI